MWGSTDDRSMPETQEGEDTSTEGWACVKVQRTGCHTVGSVSYLSFSTNWHIWRSLSMDSPMGDAQERGQQSFFPCILVCVFCYNRICKTGWFIKKQNNNKKTRNSSLTVPETEKSKIQVLTGLESGEGTLHFQHGVLKLYAPDRGGMLCPHMAESRSSSMVRHLFY
jgi:hypothetical protein